MSESIKANILGFSSNQYQLVNHAHSSSHDNLNVIKINCDNIRQLANLVRVLYKKLDIHNDYEKNLIHRLWRFRTKLNITTLNYDHDHLQIEDLRIKLQQAVNYLPNIVHDVSQFLLLIDKIKSDSQNKKMIYLKNITSTLESGARVGIYSRLVSGVQLGWSDLERQILLEACNQITFIDSKKQLANQYFDVLVIFSGLKLISIKNSLDLLYGGHARQVNILHYSQEYLSLPDKLTLPLGRPFIKRTRKKSDITMDADIADDLSKVDDIAISSYISSVTREIISHSSVEEEISKARLIMFTNGLATLLPLESKVIELSDYFDSGSSDNLLELPRKRVDELTEDDLVVLRTAGGGEYVELVADDLMLRNGHSRLRYSATSWKTLLKNALIKAGDDKFIKKYRELGGRVSSISYLHEWSGVNVISPREKNDFYNLIKTVNFFEPIEGISFDIYVEKKWSEITLLKNYHHKAGNQIRNKLLEEIKSKLITHSSFISDIRISLPGIQGAEMAILRISNIDLGIYEVPVSKLYRLEKSSSVLNG